MNPIIFPLAIFMTISIGFFLFWRAGRRDFIESEILFDSIVIALLGGLIGSRIFDFVVRSDVYSWSIKKLVFFNVYGGFDFYGGLFGVLVSSWLFLRARKANFWMFWDLASAPMALVMSLASFFRFLIHKDNLEIYIAICFFILFWSLKRLEVQKRHSGFFGCLFLFFFALILVIFTLLGQVSGTFESIIYKLVSSLVIMGFGLFSWYILAKRKIVRDVKGLVGIFLLVIFGLKRIITNLRDADNFARSVILSPYYLVVKLYYFVQLIGREIVNSIIDLTRVFKFKRQ